MTVFPRGLLPVGWRPTASPTDADALIEPAEHAPAEDDPGRPRHHRSDPLNTGEERTKPVRSRSCGSDPDSKANSRSHTGADRRGRSRLFASRGFAETTIDQIAKAAGVGERTIFRHFATKERSSSTTSSSGATPPSSCCGNGRRPSRRSEPPRGSARALREGLRPSSTGADQGRARDEPGTRRRAVRRRPRVRGEPRRHDPESTRRAVVSSRSTR